MKNIFLIKHVIIPSLFPKIVIENIKIQLNTTNNSMLHNITYNVIQLLINKLRITLFNSFYSIH